MNTFFDRISLTTHTAILLIDPCGAKMNRSISFKSKLPVVMLYEIMHNIIRKPMTEAKYLIKSV